MRSPGRSGRCSRSVSPPCGRPCAVLPIPGCDGRGRDLHGHRTADGIAVRDHWRRPAAVDVAVVSGAGVVGSIVFRVGALIFDVRNLVAYGGITIGGAMTASTLTGRRFADRQAGRRGRGPVRVRRDRQATADVVRPAVGEALVPALPLIRATLPNAATQRACGSGLGPRRCRCVKRSSGSSDQVADDGGVVIRCHLLAAQGAVASRRVPCTSCWPRVAGLPARRPRPHPRQPARFG